MKELSLMTNEELAIAYVEGCNKAFDLLLERTQSKLYAYIMFVVHEREIADDIFQETFVKAIVKMHERKYVASGKFLAWLMRIAHNEIMDIFRDRIKEGRVDVGTDNDLSTVEGSNVVECSIENRVIYEQVLTDVQRLVNFLPPTQREVVYMRYYQEMSFKEIAEATQVSINTALGRMRYAVLNLRRMAKSNRMILY